jgi:hypothetical protein
MTKVDPGFAHPIRIAAVSPKTSAATSFAEYLSGGKTVRKIASGRAFGFSETGLLGAYRAPLTPDAPRVGTSVAVSAAAPSVSLGNAHSSQQSERNVDREQSVSIAANIVSDISLFDGRLRRAPDKPFGDLILQTKLTCSTGELCRQSSDLGNVRIGHARRTSDPETPSFMLMRKQARALTLTLAEDDDGVIVSASTGDSFTVDSDEITYRFCLVAQQFGVTLNKVTVKQTTVSSEQSIRRSWA